MYLISIHLLNLIDYPSLFNITIDLQYNYLLLSAPALELWAFISLHSTLQFPKNYCLFRYLRPKEDLCFRYYLLQFALMDEEFIVKIAITTEDRING